MKFGINLPHSGPLASAEGIQRIASEAEELGYDTVWAHDHITYDTDWYLHRSSGLVQQAEDKDPNFYESLSTLTYVAGFTQQVKLGTAILALPLRDPRVLARQAMTIQALSNGRLILGVGLGDYPKDFQTMGIPYKNQVDLTEEYLQVLTTIFQGGKISYQGRFVSFQNATYYPRVSPIPILMGGGIRSSPLLQRDELFMPTLRRAAKWCQGWIPEGPPQLVTEGIRRIKELAREYGRGDLDQEIVVSLNLYLGNYEVVKEKMRRSLELEKGSVARGLEYSFIGPVESLPKTVEAYQEAGVTGLRMRCYAEDIDSFVTMIRTVAREVMPRFQ